MLKFKRIKSISSVVLVLAVIVLLFSAIESHKDYITLNTPETPLSQPFSEGNPENEFYVDRDGNISQTPPPCDGSGELIEAIPNPGGYELKPLF